MKQVSKSIKSNGKQSRSNSVANSASSNSATSKTTSKKGKVENHQPANVADGEGNVRGKDIRPYGVAIVKGNNKPLQNKAKLSKAKALNEFTGKVYLSNNMTSSLKAINLKILKLASGIKDVDNLSPKQSIAIQNIAKEFNPKDIALSLNNMERQVKADPTSEDYKGYILALQKLSMMLDDHYSVSRERKLLAIDIEVELDKFLRNCSKSASLVTKNAYEKQVRNLIQWAKDTYDLELQYLTIDHANAYKDYLCFKKVKYGDAKLANNSVNTYLTGIMAFYKHLHKKYPIVDRIFLDINRPVAQNSKPINIPTTKDAKAIMKYLYSIDSVLALQVELAVRTGFRAGAFNTLSIDNKGSFIIEWTKGKRFTGNFDKFDYIGNKPLFKGVWKDSIMGLIHKKFGKIKGRITPFSDCKGHNLSQGFINHTKQLCDNGVIEFAYSFHDLRHYFANKYYIVSGHDIVLLKGLLNHQLLNTTFKYLETVGFNSPRNNWK